MMDPATFAVSSNDSGGLSDAGDRACARRHAAVPAVPGLPYHLARHRGLFSRHPLAVPAPLDFHSAAVPRWQRPDGPRSGHWQAPPPGPCQKAASWSPLARPPGCF
jgi:hypothetical protein